ncbi:MAG TPA: hypothetical protein VGK59_10910 [Ohtaekwangia sp.]
MAKGQKHTDFNEAVLSRLDDQDKTLDQIMVLLKGSNDYGTEGLLPAVKRIEKDVHEIKEWRKETLQMKGKVDVKKMMTTLGIIGRAAAWIGGVCGGTYGVFELLKLAFE